MSDQVQSVFDRTVKEGEERLARTWPGLLATGTVGGIDVGIGLFALLVVLHETGSTLLAALAFGIGFIALTLANSELFTENFLVPISAYAAGRARAAEILRLWGGTLVMNLVGGWIVMAVIMAAAPQLAGSAREVSAVYLESGIGVQSFASAVIGGMVITLMTWMEHGDVSVGSRLVSAVAAAFLLAAAHLQHAVVVSMTLFAALQVGAPFGYADWLALFAWVTLGNAVGGVFFVTALRLVQVGARKLTVEQERSADGAPNGVDRGATDAADGRPAKAAPAR